MKADQPDLFDARSRPASAPPIPKINPGDPNVAFLVRLLDGREWKTAAELLEEMQQPVTDAKKRWVRALAEASGGQVAGGQKGYKLVRDMRNTEYQHWRNWMTHQADEMKRRVIEADRVFFGRKPVEVM